MATYNTTQHRQTVTNHIWECKVIRKWHTKSQKYNKHNFPGIILKMKFNHCNCHRVFHLHGIFPHLPRKCLHPALTKLTLLFIVSGPVSVSDKLNQQGLYYITRSVYREGSMSQLFLELLRCKRSINSLTILVEYGIRAWCSRLSRSCASVHPDKTDQTHNEKHRSEPTADEPRPHQQPHDKFQRTAEARMLYIMTGSELQRSALL